MTHRTTACIVTAWQAGREIHGRGIVAAERAPHYPGGWFAILADGSRVHSDHVAIRCHGVLSSLADLPVFDAATTEALNSYRPMV